MLLRKAARYVRHPSLVGFEIERRSRLREVSKFDFRPYTSAPISNNTYISLTSYGARLNAVHMAIRSLLMQSVRPSKVLLYFDESIQRDTLSDDLLDLEQYGLEIRMGYEDLGPHKKYLFAFQEFPDSLIITADDDLIYPADMVESLLTAHETVPYCVVARRCHLIGFYAAGDLLPYEKWGWEHKDAFSVPSRRLLATGGAGALYPVAAFDLASLDIEAIRGVAWPADDLYLKFFELANGIEVAYAPNRQNHPYQLEGPRSDALCNANVAGGRNDAIMAELMCRYGLRPSYFEEGYRVTSS